MAACERCWAEYTLRRHHEGFAGPAGPRRGVGTSGGATRVRERGEEVTKFYVEGQRLGLPPGTVAVYLASEVDAEIDFLKGELKAVETKAGIENIIEQAKAQERAEYDAEIAACDLYSTSFASLEEQLTAAKAEVERLREQLAWAGVGPGGTTP